MTFLTFSIKKIHLVQFTNSQIEYTYYCNVGTKQEYR